MNTKFLLHLVLLLISFQLSAQEFTLALSQHPNKKAVLVAIHGVRKDTIGTIQLDQNGKGKLAFKNKQPQAGLVNLTIIDKAYLSYDFVLSPTENPTLSCDMEYVYAQNTKISNSPENDCLNRWFDGVAQYKQRIALNQELSKLYTPKMPFSKQLATEKQIVEQQLRKITDTINQSTLFAGKYMQFKLAQEEKLAKVWESNEQKAIAKNYFATQIDFDALYGSSMWFSTINTCMEVYTKENPYFGTFGTDVVGNLKRIKNQQVYEDLIDAAISVTEKFVWNKDQEAIVDYIVKDNRIKNPQGKIQKMIQSYNLSVGKKAPNLVLPTQVGSTQTTILKTDELNSKYTLLFFYQSGCGHCDTAIAGLKSNYKDLIAKGLKIISIAGDTDQDTYSKAASTFPWAATTYCDLKGMNGINFKNYAVIGTPMMYVLNSKGMIITKPATVEELLAWSKGN
ncbi:MAG: peroxiredoxin family protein [Chitinophagales bacterium]